MKIQVVHKKQEDGSVTHHARIKGGNGEIVWVTETYDRSAGAFGAVELLQRMFAGEGAVVGSAGYVVEEIWE